MLKRYTVFLLTFFLKKRKNKKIRENIGVLEEIKTQRGKLISLKFRSSGGSEMLPLEYQKDLLIHPLFCRMFL
jgi:hypothetical protein